MCPLSVIDEVTDTVSVDGRRTIRENGHLLIFEVAEGIFVHRHYQRDTRDISAADDLEVVANAHLERRKEQKRKRPGLPGKAVNLLVLVWLVVYQRPRETVLIAEVSCLFDCVKRTLPDISSFLRHI